MTVAGRGFDSTTVISVGGEPCTVSSVSPTSIQCTTAANSGSGSVLSTVEVEDNGVVKQLTDAYTYKDSLTGEVTAVSPSRGGTAGGTRITVSGSGFG